jgi:hypothetical protein
VRFGDAFDRRPDLFRRMGTALVVRLEGQRTLMPEEATVAIGRPVGPHSAIDREPEAGERRRSGSGPAFAVGGAVSRLRPGVGGRVTGIASGAAIRPGRRPALLAVLVEVLGEEGAMLPSIG